MAEYWTHDSDIVLCAGMSACAPILLQSTTARPIVQCEAQALLFQTQYGTFTTRVRTGKSAQQMLLD